MGAEFVLLQKIIAIFELSYFRRTVGYDDGSFQMFLETKNIGKHCRNIAALSGVVICCSTKLEWNQHIIIMVCV